MCTRATTGYDYRFQADVPIWVLGFFSAIFNLNDCSETPFSIHNAAMSSWSVLAKSGEEWRLRDTALRPALLGQKSHVYVWRDMDF